MNMKKRVFIFVVLLVLFTGGAFAQTHWISAEIYGLGAGIRYEYVSTPSFTLGGYFSFIWLPVPVTELLTGNGDNSELHFGGGITGRWYPFARRFFAELSLGFNGFDYSYEEYSGRHYEYYWDRTSGFCISPGFGWTIDVGKMGGFFISAGTKMPMTFGNQFDLIFVPYFGFGSAF